MIFKNLGQHILCSIFFCFVQSLNLFLSDHFETVSYLSIEIDNNQSDLDLIIYFFKEKLILQ